MRVSSCCALRANGPQPAFSPPFPPAAERCALTCVEFDHLGVGRAPTPRQFPEQILPKPAPRPAHEAVIDRCRRTVFGRAIAPAAAALENMHNPADDPAVIDPLNAPNIGRQMRLDPCPLLVVQPKQIPPHDPDPLPKTNSGSYGNQDCPASTPKLMSSHPSGADLTFARQPADPGCECWNRTTSMPHAAVVPCLPSCDRRG